MRKNSLMVCSASAAATLIAFTSGRGKQICSGVVGGAVGAGVGGAVGAVEGVLGIPHHSYRHHYRCRGYYDSYGYYHCFN